MILLSKYLGVQWIRPCVEGPFVGFQGTMERSIVGGNGKFRMARGYYQLTVLEFPTASTVLAEIDICVLTCHRSYM